MQINLRRLRKYIFYIISIYSINRVLKCGMLTRNGRADRGALAAVNYGSPMAGIDRWIGPKIILWLSARPQFGISVD